MITLTKKAPKIFTQVAEKAFENLGLSGEAFVEVEFVSRVEMHEINHETRGVDKSTDVLSFPMLDEILPFTKSNYKYDYDPDIVAVRLGSVIICKEIAAEQAKEYGHSQRREQAYLFLHGLLHLLGYDHIDDAEKKAMREKEEEILSELNVRRN